ncbi:ATP12 family chaperone protein [Salibaculum griseiflavum]|uniref:ATPase n=1 Tax=Salibaculum griseiflavum TaxID=1914409 RepID=A0A2V1PBM0_9RHOB|nr:ATP12 family protein [Salibaculum griseiflavum]PWG18587.1 ATPase [Salibaculum griseiflavum]
MSEWQAKRFWKEVTVVETEDGHGIELDGRPVKTPTKAPVAVPSAALAHAIAREWDAVEDVIEPVRMPMTRAANSAIDKVSVQFDEVADMLADYAGSDLLCYRAEGPEELCERQRVEWDPLLDWAEETYGARLRLGQGIMPVAQDDDALNRLRRAAHDQTVFQLTALHDLVTITGSLVLGLAISRGHLGADRAFDLSRLDEDWQIEQWGADDEAVAVAAIKRQQLEQAALLYSMV